MTKTTCIAILLVCLISSCTEKMICPAYQSVFILDDNYRERFFSPFHVVAGDTVPKGGYTLQRERSKFFITKIWTKPEQPVLENPYLMARIFNKRPYWKLDIIKPEIIQFISRDTVDVSIGILGDSLEGDSIIVEEPVQSVLNLPKRYPPYNQDQIEYNKKFGHLFPRPPQRPDPADSLDGKSLQEFASDTLATDTVPQKKGIFGMFKKKNKPPKQKKKRDKKRNKNNEEGTLEEEDK